LCPARAAAGFQQLGQRQARLGEEFPYAFPPRGRSGVELAFHHVHSAYDSYGGFGTSRQQFNDGDKEPALRLTCQPGTLGQALQTVSRAISTRTTLPILNNILLETTPEGLTLTATNLEIGIRKSVPAEVQREGSATAPARLLTDFVGSLPEQDLQLDFEQGNQTLNLR